jgi:hypothetical protein
MHRRRPPRSARVSKSQKRQHRRVDIALGDQPYDRPPPPRVCHTSRVAHRRAPLTARGRERRGDAPDSDATPASESGTPTRRVAKLFRHSFGALLVGPVHSERSSRLGADPRSVQRVSAP